MIILLLNLNVKDIIILDFFYRSVFFKKKKNYRKDYIAVHIIVKKKLKNYGNLLYFFALLVLD